MRGVVTAVALVLLVASSTQAQQAPPDLQKAIDARVAAQRAGDAESWGRYTTDDFIVVDPSGGVGTKTSRMAQIKGNKNTNPSPKISDQRFRAYGDTVIVTQVQEGAQGPTRFTTVWVKQNNQWRVASVHQTRVTK
jgi:ketosteroid isomerase-like protein